MINFRFHLVSLIAVFLALGLGILVGSTVVDQVIVDRLDSEIRTVRHESSDRNAENAKLKTQLSKDDDVLRRLGPYAVQNRLVGVPVAIVAETGVDSGVLKEIVTTLRAAGATVPGVVWLERGWRLDTDAQLTALDAGANVTGNAAAARRAALQLLARRLAAPMPAATRTSDVMESLRSAGFVSFSEGGRAAFDAFPVRASRALVVTGNDTKLDGTDAFGELVQAFQTAHTPTVAAEVYDDHGGALPVPQRGATLAPVRGDRTLVKHVSTVDDAETIQGQVSAVIALQDLAEGTVGHYGYGTGASIPFPESASP